MCTRDINDGAAIEVLGEQLGVEGCTHQDDLQVRSVGKHVSQVHHQEVTVEREHFNVLSYIHVPVIDFIKFCTGLWSLSYLWELIQVGFLLIR